MNADACGKLRRVLYAMLIQFYLWNSSLKHRSCLSKSSACYFTSCSCWNGSLKCYFRYCFVWLNCSGDTFLLVLFEYGLSGAISEIVHVWISDLCARNFGCWSCSTTVAQVLLEVLFLFEYGCSGATLDIAFVQVSSLGALVVGVWWLRCYLRLFLCG